ncbi:MAG: hypothetical protein MJY95_04480 [Bacteroidaceae bacterium]|nr:hypothetical protein [Bacteroidaceae bacterium]
MKKFYALLSAVLMSSMAFAQGTMTEENATLDEMGYRLEKDVDWYAGTVNGVSFCPEGYEMGSGVDVLSYTSAESNGIKLNNYSINQCTNEGMEWFYLQLTGNGIVCNPGSNGLISTKNERWIAMNGLRGGQIIVFDLSNNDPVQFVTSSTACNANTGWADTMTDPLQVYEITDSIHALQEIASGEGTADTFRYFQVNPESNGWLYAKFNGKSATRMWRMQIWSDKNDAEAVSAPIFSMKGVYGKDRRIGIKPGTSTFNNEVLTYYSLDGSEPLFLEETDEIERIDSIAIEGEEGEEIVWQVDTIYKKKAVQYGGEWGDFCYDTSLGEEAYITITEAEDEDGDGYITVKARTISVEGAYSDVTEMAYQIGEIYLNAPTLTPVGMNGVDRDYQIGWTNNTLCGEEYTITTTIDGDFPTTEYALGDVVSAALSIKVVVEAEGYEPAETEITVLEQGTEFFVKPIGEDSERSYFWDFVNLTQEQIEKIDHQWVESAFVADSVANDTTWYTRQQYLDGECPDEAEPVFGYFGWDELDTRQAGRHWQTLNRFEETVVGSEGQDSIVYTFEYAGDLTDLFHDGFVYENSYGGTYPDHWSNTAIFTNGALLNDGNHGLYNNSNHATIIVPNVQYGEYVVYTTSTGSVCEPCQVGETETEHTFGYTKDIGKNVYLYSVGVYTQENLPDAIEHITAPTERVNKNLIFDLSGRRVKNPVSGIYIKNGKKYLIK